MRNNTTIESKFIGCLTKKGKKNTFRKIFLNSLNSLSKSLNIKTATLLNILTRKLGTIVDIKMLKIRKNTFIVPVPVNSRRRNYLVIKKILVAVKNNSSNISLEEKLIMEMTNIIKGKNSYSLMQRNNILKDASKNKSNTHYRW